MRLGIDFGTTRTVVAAALDGRHPVASFDVGGSLRGHIPGIVARASGGELLFGWDAAELMAREPQAGVRSIKRIVARLLPDEPIPVLETTALEATTGFLAYLRRQLLSASSLSLGPRTSMETMIAVPANASTRQRYLTLEAFRRAGFEVLGLMNEPTAAAIEYAHRHLADVGPKSPKQYVVVYDLGGGTFDASAVSLVDRRFELLTTEGIGALGGDDFDELLLQLALEVIGVAPEQIDPKLWPTLLESAREAKETLGPNSKKLMLDLSAWAPAQDAVLVDTARLYARAEPLVTRSLEVLDRLLGELPAHGIDPEDARKLAAIYLVGGGVSFPAVGRALRARYARKLRLAPEPQAATAIGLAVAADPGAELRVSEAPTRCFGVWREANDGQEKVFDPIIERSAGRAEGEALVVERRYHPAHRVGRLRFMECTRVGADGMPMGDLVPSALVHFPYDPGLAAEGTLAEVAGERAPELSEELIVERYTYQLDGRISVVIRNHTRGYERSYDLQR